MAPAALLGNIHYGYRGIKEEGFDCLLAESDVTVNRRGRSYRIVDPGSRIPDPGSRDRDRPAIPVFFQLWRLLWPRFLGDDLFGTNT